MFLPVKPDAAATSRYLARQSLTADNAIVETITRTAAARRPTFRYSIAREGFTEYRRSNNKSITNRLSSARTCVTFFTVRGCYAKFANLVATSQLLFPRHSLQQHGSGAERLRHDHGHH